MACQTARDYILLRQAMEVSKSWRTDRTPMGQEGLARYISSFAYVYSTQVWTGIYAALHMFTLLRFGQVYISSIAHVYSTKVWAGIRSSAYRYFTKV